MLLLTTPNTILRLTTGSAGDIQVNYSAVDRAGTIETYIGDVLASIASATTTTLIQAPAASTVRNPGDLSIANNHATTSNLCTLEIFDGTDAAVKWQGTLLAGEIVVFDEIGAWSMYDADGLLAY